MDKIGTGKFEANAIGTGTKQRNMAFPKPIRMLAAACMALFFFLALQIIRKPGVIQPPGVGEHDWNEDMVRDPNLDSKRSHAPGSKEGG